MRGINSDINLIFSWDPLKVTTEKTKTKKTKHSTYLAFIKDIASCAHLNSHVAVVFGKAILLGHHEINCRTLGLVNLLKCELSRLHYDENRTIDTMYDCHLATYYGLPWKQHQLLDSTEKLGHLDCAPIEN